MSKYLKVIIYLFPLFLVGIFFITLNTMAQNAVVSATVKISVCGNFIAEGGEDCDNDDFGGLSCSNYGHNSGDLSCNPDCSVDTSACYTEDDDSSSGGGGGGAGPIIVPPTTAVNFSGKAYPLSTVTVLRDGQVAVSTIAGPDANFNVRLSGLSTGNYNFSVYSEDPNGHRSSLFSFPVYITSGSTTNISGIFLAPSISVDKSQVKQGEDIAIFGQSVPNATITISVNSEQEHFRYINADNNGAYLHYFDTALLEKGEHTAKSKARLAEEVSPYGLTVAFAVGDSNVDKPDDEGQCGEGGADLNCDGRVNLIDFSVAAYWYQRINPPAEVDLNHDGKVNLVDFSIMAFYWTG